MISASADGVFHRPNDARLQLAVVVLTALALPLLVFGRGFTQSVFVVDAILAGVLAWRTGLPAIDLGECRPLLWSFAAVTVAWLPSVPGSIDPLASLVTLCRLVLLVLGSLMLWTALRRSPAAHRQALKLLVAGLAILVIPVAIATLFMGRADFLPRSMKPKASAYVVVLPVIAYAGMFLGRRWLWLAVAAIAGIVMLAFGTSSRSSLAGLAAAGIIVVTLYAFRHRRRGLVVLILAATLAPALAGVVKPWPRGYDKQSERYSLYLPPSIFDAHRQVIWRFTFHKYLERPVFGWGINVINRSPGAGEEVPGMQQEYIPAHPHSWLVEVASETGTVGILALVGAILSGLIHMGRGFMRQGRIASLAGIGVVTSFWTSAAFNFSIWATWWELIPMIALALVFSQKSSPQPQDQG